MIGIIWGIVIAAEAEATVLATLKGAEFARMGIVAEILERPVGVSDEVFAQRLIDAEGLRPWNGEQIDAAPRSGPWGVKAVVSGDGREINVRYVAGDQRVAGRICRIRMSRGGWSDARWSAYRWCASALGFELPLAPPPPIVSIPR